MALTMSLDEAIAGGDPFTIKAVAKRDAAQAHERGYLEGVQDQQTNQNYALVSDGIMSVAWFRLLSDAELAKAALNDSWEDLRIVDIQQGAN